MFGIGTALAIVIDATVIRGVVVPAFLRLAGEFNWWAPAPLRWLHDRIGLSETPEPDVVATPAAAPTESDETTIRNTRTLDRTSQVEVLPGNHVVAHLDGTVIVVAHREAAPLSPGSVAAQQVSTLLDTVRRCDRRRLAGALSVLASTNRAMADFAVVVRSGGALDVYLYGAVTVGFDTGATPSELCGAPGRIRAHRSLPVPAVATVVTVDEEGRQAPDRRQWTGVFTLAVGTVPGRGAVIWTTRPIPARQAPEEDVTTRIDRDATIRIGPPPQGRRT